MRLGEQYGGESNAKKLARADLWSYFQRVAAKESMAQKSLKVLVLCGPHGHDIRCAVAHGFSAENIVACDTDRAALAAACVELGPRFHNAVLRHEDLVEAVARDSFDIIFADACSPVLLLADRLVPAIAKRVGTTRQFSDGHGVYRGAFLALGGMYGRDGRFLGGVGEGLEPDHRRVLALTEALVRLAARDLAVYVPHVSSSYLSRREEGGVFRQTPMIYAAGIYVASAGEARDDAFGARLPAPTNPEVQHVVRSSRSLRRMHEAKSRRLQKKQSRGGWALKPRSFGHDADGARVRAAAIGLAKVGGSAHAADVYCLEEGTVRAWLAHETRGTYAEGAR